MEASRNFNDVQVYTGGPEKVLQAEPVGGNLVPVAPLPMMQSKTAYHTAVTVQRPRDLDKVVAAVKREAALAGEAFYWSWPVKTKNKQTNRWETKTLSGPSIGLAMCIAREWTNVAVPVDYLETATHDIFTAHFVDLERGFTVSRIWKQSKAANKDLGSWGAERAGNMTFQKAQSQAIRNAVLAGVPKWLVDQAKEIAMDSVLKGITPEKIALARKQSVKVFAARGVNEARLVAAMGVPIAQWGPEEIVNLKGMLNQLKDGTASADELFPQVEGKAAPAAAEEKAAPATEEKAPAEKKKAEPAGKKAGPVKGITDETAKAIKTEGEAKGLNLVNLLAGVPVGELTEEDGQKALAAIRALAGKEPETAGGIVIPEAGMGPATGQTGGAPAAGEDGEGLGW